MKKLHLLLLFIAITAMAVAQKIDYKPVEVEVYQLKNGLTVILNEDHNAPQVFGGVVVRAGGKDDPKGATGMAHYQEHMLFKGTQELGTTDWKAEKLHIDNIFALYDELGKTTDPAEREKIQKQINEESVKANEYAIPNELDKLIKSMGGTDLNAGTGPDITVYYNAFPATQIEKWLDLYSHRFENPVFRSFQAELEVVYEEKNMYSDMFIFPLLESFNESFFKNHPYGQQTLVGTIEDLKNPSLNKMFEFFETWYVPNNMALIIAGDFDTKTIKPIIEEKFGDWEYKELPKRPVYEEKSFNGREFKEVKMSPIKLGLLGYRTPKAGEADEVVIEICNALLSNENQTGYLDKLVLDNIIMAAQPIYMPYNDYGACIFLLVPKIVGQKLQDAETLVKAEIDRLRNGDFDEAMLESIKLQLYKNFQLSMESNDYKMNMFASAFGRYQNIDEMLVYPKLVMAVTKEEVVKVAAKYYADNYLAFYSNMGFPKKEKIDKPGFEPVTKNTDAQSDYAKKFEKIPMTKIEPRFISFKKDVQEYEVSGGMRLFWVDNPANDIFTLKIKFKVGSEAIPNLKYAVGLMDFAAPRGTDPDDFNRKMASLGCSYSFYGDESYTVLELTGIETSLKDALSLLAGLLQSPELDQSKIDIIYEGEKANRKMERSEPDNVADALLSYVRYGAKSDYLDRLSLSEIKALKAENIVKDFSMATQYCSEVHFTGKTKPEELTKQLAVDFAFTGKEVTESPYVRDIAKYSENTVYFVNKKKATQSKIYFLVNGFEYSPEYQAAMDAFNLYFGGDFSGLVLQEIREYRSMAYSAGARFGSPALKGKEAYFIGFVGTQADKTLDALQVFDSLIHQMPVKKERVEMIRPYLLQSSVADRPHFRSLSEQVVRWQNMGYTEDPAKFKRDEYEKLEFETIMKFYETNLAKKPVVVCIVGNKKRIDMKALAKYGKVIEIKESSLFGK